MPRAKWGLQPVRSATRRRRLPNDPGGVVEHAPPVTSDRTLYSAGTPGLAVSGLRRLCLTDHHSEMPMSVAPMSPVIVSGT